MFPSLLMLIASVVTAGLASHDNVQEEVTASPAIVDRSSLATIPGSSSGDTRYLSELGREGVFVFDASDLSSEVAADKAQVFYLAPISDRSGASGAWVRKFDGPVNAEWFGFSTSAGQAHNSRALQNAISTSIALGQRTLRIPAKTYALGHVIISGSNLIIDMTGATLRGTGIRLETDARSSHINFLGGRVIEESSPSYLFNFRGTDINVDGTTFEKLVADDTYHGYIRRGTERIRMVNFRLVLADDGIYVEGKDHAFANFVISGQKGGNADDAFAIKAIGQYTENIDIGPGVVSDMYDIVGIGSEIGGAKPGVDDPVYSGRVRGIAIHDIVAERLTNAIFIKPGGVARYDYRNGVVEDVTIENIVIRDPTGAKFRKGLAIHPGRNSIVRRIKARNIVIEARALDPRGFNKNSAAEVWGQKVSGYGGAGPSISDIDVGLSFSDPHEGAANSASAPGYPLHHIVHVRADAGSIERITLRVTGNGSQESGIQIAPGLDGSVRIERAHLRNVSRAPSFGPSASGGIAAHSDVVLGTDLRIEAPDRTARGYAIGGVHPAMGSVSWSGPGVREQVFQLGSIPAGTSVTKPLFSMPTNSAIVSVELFDRAGVQLDARNYLTLRLRQNGATFATLATNSRAVAAETLTRLHRTSTIVDSDGLFVATDALIAFEKIDVGTGAAVTDAFARIRYIPFGE